MSEKKENEVIQVGVADPEKNTSPIIDAQEDETGSTDEKVGICLFNGLQYGTGAQICSGGTMLRCNYNGSWYRVGPC